MGKPIGKGITYTIIGWLALILLGVFFMIWFIGPSWSQGFEVKSKAILQGGEKITTKAESISEPKRTTAGVFYPSVEFIVGDKITGDRIQPPTLYLTQGGK